MPDDSSCTTKAFIVVGIEKVVMMLLMIILFGWGQYYLFDSLGACEKYCSFCSALSECVGGNFLTGIPQNDARNPSTKELILLRVK